MGGGEGGEWEEGGGGISEPDPFLGRFGFEIRQGQIITIKVIFRTQVGNR